jgi:hypothetical protein
LTAILSVGTVELQLVKMSRKPNNVEVAGRVASAYVATDAVSTVFTILIRVLLFC